jgi:hypothetical protein
MKMTTTSRTGGRHFTQWAAQFYTAAELTRRGYLISFTLGNAPATDLQVTSPTGISFPVEIKGLQASNWWIVRRPDPKIGRFYILVLVPSADVKRPPRYFVLNTKQLLTIHQDDPKWPGMNFGAVAQYENAWEALPR